MKIFVYYFALFLRLKDKTNADLNAILMPPSYTPFNGANLNKIHRSIIRSTLFRYELQNRYGRSKKMTLFTRIFAIYAVHNFFSMVLFGRHKRILSHWFLLWRFDRFLLNKPQGGGGMTYSRYDPTKELKLGSLEMNQLWWGRHGSQRLQCCEALANRPKWSQISQLA